MNNLAAAAKVTAVHQSSRHVPRHISRMLFRARPGDDEPVNAKSGRPGCDEAQAPLVLASDGQLMMEAAVMNHPLWGRRSRSKQVVLACLIVALAGVLLSVRGSVNTDSDTAATGDQRGWHRQLVIRQASSSSMTSSMAHRWTPLTGTLP